MTTLEGTGSTEFELPNVGNWTVTAQLNGESVSEVVNVSGALLYEVDLMITSGIAVTTQPTKTTYFIGETFNPAGMVVTAYYTDDTSRAVTGVHLLPHRRPGHEQHHDHYFLFGGQRDRADHPGHHGVQGAGQYRDHHAAHQTAYFSGETFNPAGMVVTAHYNDGSSAAVSGYTYSPSGAWLRETTRSPCHIRRAG